MALRGSRATVRLLSTVAAAASAGAMGSGARKAALVAAAGVVAATGAVVVFNDAKERFVDARLARAFTVVACENSKLQPEPVFSPDQLAVFASRVADYVDVPLLPEAAERLVIVKALSAVVRVLSHELPDRLRTPLRAALAAALSDDEQKALVRELATFVNRKIDLPFLNENEEQMLYEKIMDAMIKLARPADPELQGHYSASHLMHDATGAVKVLLAPEQRKRLADYIVNAVDLPYVNKHQEQVYVEKAIDVIASRVNGLLPPDFVAALRGASPEEMVMIRERLVKRLEATAHITMVGHDMQEALYEHVVAAMLEGVNASSTPAFLDDNETRLAKTMVTEQTVKEELKDLEKHTTERRQLLHAQLGRVQAARWDLQKKTSWFWWLVSLGGVL